MSSRDNAAAAPDLPAVSISTTAARLPATYENAKTTLATCVRIDECKDWHDKAAALASYAKQAKDDELRQMALRVQARAIHRAGELLQEIPPAYGANQNIRAGDHLNVITRAQAAEDAGLSEHQRKTALRVAGLSREEFENAIESFSPPTITELAERGIARRGCTTGVAMDPYAERGLDLYETPDCATRALLKVESLRGPIWEPACGPGEIVRVLRQTGHRVIATDIKDDAYRCPDSSGGIDFLKERRAPEGVETICTNPPFMFADEFVRHALTLVPRVVMFLRFLFLEGQGRSDLIDGGQLPRVFLFTDRLPMLHRAGWQGPKATNSPQIAFAWFSWDRDYRGPIVVRRILAKAEAISVPPPPAESEKPYDAADDFNGSINDCYAAVRECVAAGGATWTPPPAAPDPLGSDPLDIPAFLRRAARAAS
jgi:hypothetical protein